MRPDSVTLTAGYHPSWTANTKQPLNSGCQDISTRTTDSGINVQTLEVCLQSLFCTVASRWMLLSTVYFAFYYRQHNLQCAFLFSFTRSGLRNHYYTGFVYNCFYIDAEWRSIIHWFQNNAATFWLCTLPLLSDVDHASVLMAGSLNISSSSNLSFL
jgi:hypothetical protein